MIFLALKKTTWLNIKSRITHSFLHFSWNYCSTVTTICCLWKFWFQTNVVSIISDFIKLPGCLEKEIYIYILKRNLSPSMYTLKIYWERENDSQTERERQKVFNHYFFGGMPITYMISICLLNDLLIDNFYLFTLFF